jgi:hypothetical protein
MTTFYTYRFVNITFLFVTRWRSIILIKKDRFAWKRSLHIYIFFYIKSTRYIPPERNTALVEVQALVREQEQEHILALVLKLVEVLHTVVEPVHKLEQVQHMDALLEQVQVVEQVQDRDILLVLVLAEEEVHQMVLVQ